MKKLVVYLSAAVVVASMAMVAVKAQKGDRVNVSDGYEMLTPANNPGMKVEKLAA